MKGGEVSSVIESLSQRIRAAGKTPKIYDNSWALAQECRTDDKGITPCYGAVLFFSSPTEATNISSQGHWNYTVRAQDAGSIDIRTTTSSSERVLLPLQRAVDLQIVSQSASSTNARSPSDIDLITFTEQDQDALSDSRKATYLSLSIYVFGPLFAFTLVEIVYHMTSFVSRERELGTYNYIPEYSGNLTKCTTIQVCLA